MLPVRAGVKLPLPIGLHFMYNTYMAKSISVKQKKKGRGRPATGHDPLVGVRMPHETIAAVDKWAEKEGVPSRSEAVRKLVERGLQN
jgi:Predicted transcriptional regulators containing the CopG/Arc/MetJ DNA-binding domain and a metal-binding domain